MLTKTKVTEEGASWGGALVSLEGILCGLYMSKNHAPPLARILTDHHHGDTLGEALDALHYYAAMGSLSIVLTVGGGLLGAHYGTKYGKELGEQLYNLTHPPKHL